MRLFPDRVEVEPADPRPSDERLAQHLGPTVFLGTSSWSFPGWVGEVWRRPCSAKTLAQDGLGAYAAHPLMRSVSIDRAYHAPVPDEVWASYAKQVPESFRAMVKAHRGLTTAALAGTADDNPDFLTPALGEVLVDAALRHLGDRVGVFLLQLPPQRLPRDTLGRLERLLAVLSDRVTVGVEPRAGGLLGPQYADVLARHGAVHVLSVHPSMPDLRTQWVEGGVARGPMVVARWNLPPDLHYEEAKAQWAPFSELQRPDDGTVDRLAKAIVWARTQGRPALVIANNKAEGCAPSTVRRIASRVSALDS